MTTVLINAVSVREGGSLVVLRRLLAAMMALRPAWDWHVASNAEAHERNRDLTGVTWHVYPNAEISGLRVRWWYEHELPRLAIRTCAEILFSQTNYLPARRLPCPSLLLVQHAGHFSSVFHQLMARKTSLPGRVSWQLKGRWVRASVRKAAKVTVQTQALADRIVEDTGIASDDVVVIPHGTGLADEPPAVRRRPERDRPVRIGYISKHGIQKNFEVLLQAAVHLNESGIAPEIVLTLPTGHRETEALMALAATLGIGHCIKNHGELQPGEIDKLYRTLDIFVFSSLCESFGFPLVEAMAYGLPLVAADTASNRDVLGPAGVRVAPRDAAELAGALKRLVLDDQWFQDCSERSLARARTFSWETSAARSIELIEQMVRRREMPDA